jgi:hypothetical protein
MLPIVFIAPRCCEPGCPCVNRILLFEKNKKNLRSHRGTLCVCVLCTPDQLQSDVLAMLTARNWGGAASAATEVSCLLHIVPVLFLSPSPPMVVHPQNRYNGVLRTTHTTALSQGWTVAMASDISMRLVAVALSPTTHHIVRHILGCSRRRLKSLSLSGLVPWVRSHIHKSTRSLRHC